MSRLVLFLAIGDNCRLAYTNQNIFHASPKGVSPATKGTKTIKCFTIFTFAFHFNGIVTWGWTFVATSLDLTGKFEMRFKWNHYWDCFDISFQSFSEWINEEIVVCLSLTIEFLWPCTSSGFEIDIIVPDGQSLTMHKKLLFITQFLEGNLKQAKSVSQCVRIIFVLTINNGWVYSLSRTWEMFVNFGNIFVGLE